MVGVAQLVERAVVVRVVVGSSPTVHPMKARKGNFSSFDIWSLRLVVRTRDFHSRNRSSILLGITKNPIEGSGFFVFTIIRLIVLKATLGIVNR